MADAFETYSPASAQCIVLDPSTFEVLAMVNYPGYDLNDVPRDDNDLLNALSRNNLVSDIYEPGSTFKIVTAAINVEETCAAFERFFPQTRVQQQPHPHGRRHDHQVLEQSRQRKAFQPDARGGTQQQL
ncbi:MAG: penicillin-binding transpeptidase domain-containing protein [Candidatus Borkfalkia sp.]